MLQDNLIDIRNRIMNACKRSDREQSDIKVVAVTKFIDESLIKQALELGITDIGENKAQEIRRKYPAFESATRHMIGVLQVNKVKMIIDLVDMIQSADRKKLIDEIEVRAAKSNRIMDILIQVNIAREEQKSGVYLENLEDLLYYASGKEHVRVKGLMAIMPDIRDEIQLRAYFSDMKKVFDEYANKVINHVEMKYLSMGMSGDFEIAIEEGANMIRLGSAVFQSC